VQETTDLLVEIQRKAEEMRLLELAEREAEWRRTFQPHAVIQTQRTVPTQIFICGLTGGAERWLIIRFDLSRPPVTFVEQALEGLKNKSFLTPSGTLGVGFFGAALGIIVNFSPDRAVRFDLEGNPLEVLERAYRPGQASLSVGVTAVSPKVMADLIGAL
jgi:hypothetical protein